MNQSLSCGWEEGTRIACCGHHILVLWLSLCRIHWGTRAWNPISFSARYESSRGFITVSWWVLFSCYIGGTSSRRRSYAWKKSCRKRTKKLSKLAARMPIWTSVIFETRFWVQDVIWWRKTRPTFQWLDADWKCKNIKIYPSNKSQYWWRIEWNHIHHNGW